MMNYQKKMLIAIPTYNHAHDVKYFIESTEFLMNSNWIDLIFYDSSENDDTKMVIDSLKQRKVNNVSIERVNCEISSNEKVFIIYEKNILNYEYIWLLHDHTIFSEEALSFIKMVLENKPDFVFLNTQAEDYKIELINDITAFAKKNAWLLGKMGASIVGTNNFLGTVDWNYYRDKYLTNININFSHVGLYLEHYINVPKIKGISVLFPRFEFTDTNRYKKLNWENEIIRICTECWGNVISNLPVYYGDKNEIIHSIDKYFITKYKLIELKKNKIYGIWQFLKYRKWIELVFSNDYDDFRYIAFGTENGIYKKYIKTYKEMIEKERKAGRKIYVYGAGKHGIECVGFFDTYGVIVDGVIVSNKKGNPDVIKGNKVYEIKEIDNMGEKIFIILAVMKNLQHEIVKTIKELNVDCKYIEWNQ